MTEPRKRIHLAAHFPGVNSTTVWSDPESGSQTAFSSFVHLARTAERGLFDFFFLAEGLRLREHRGRIFDLDVVGRPDTLTVLNALAAVTDHLGLAGTINTTFNEPYELARQFASLDHLSGGRAAWNLVTSSDAFTGENFRRGGFLPHSERYQRAAETVAAARELWDSWDADAIVADAAGGVFARPEAVRPVQHRGPHHSVDGFFTTPRSPQGHPVLIQAGDSPDGRDFGAATADVIFSRHGTLAAGQEFYRDVKGRLAAHGRTPDDLKIMPGVTVVLGDTAAEAEERAAHIRRQQVSPAGAIAFLEQVWGRDLSGYDPDGPLPREDPDPANTSVTRGRVRHDRDVLATARQWRELAERKGLSIRELVIEVAARQSFIGTPRQVAEAMDAHVQQDACDGFILVPHLTPTGLDEFVDRVVPELQERGVFRTAYTSGTLRGHLGLPHPDRRRAPAAVG
ncbi:NtaA/DmoA family FMN-dependent monooxygenase [Allostreptomyces psammosilenae]|uniref:FMN-dependent oxidoreductase (Nitrilotriacetate monooxygenase family) n=1 Tax=Allostreptomyces psammosilenae TaxID=1892865 RepID=A0A853A1P2_9ACTN|nr:NtaA/DmoA family FMN-dependent monooxygenase [Allostreptomyces psammosilenae]NYI04338.1 FMN-dependent oxidoreductase (nitrilotriacetate monooxygenase family) [Allostreptomyces psammosilenae]